MSRDHVMPVDRAVLRVSVPVRGVLRVARKRIALKREDDGYAKEIGS